MRRVWVCDWGEFDIPADVPARFRKDGWFDRRLRVTPALRLYFSDMEHRLSNGYRPIGWVQWAQRVRNAALKSALDILDKANG